MKLPKKIFENPTDAFLYAYKKFLKKNNRNLDGNCSFNFYRNTKGVYVEIYNDFTSGFYNVGDYLRSLKF